MFTVKVLGFFDLISALVLFISTFGDAGVRAPIAVGAYLLVKGFLFRGDLASAIDMIIGVYAILTLLFGSAILTFVLGGLLIIKGLVSLF